jgi:mRNA interferase RelE/StbE
MNVQYTKRAIKTLNRLDAVTKQRIREAINSIPAGDIKPLVGAIGANRLRVGGWRIIFKYVDNNVLLVEKIASRGQAY